MIAASVRYAPEVNRSSQQMFSSSTVQQAEEVRTRVERTHLTGQALDARRTEMRTINDYAPVGTRKVGTGQVSSVQPVTFKRQVNPNHLLDMQILDGPKQVCLPHHPQLGLRPSTYSMFQKSLASAHSRIIRQWHNGALGYDF